MFTQKMCLGPRELWNIHSFFVGTQSPVIVRTGFSLNLSVFLGDLLHSTVLGNHSVWNTGWLSSYTAARGANTYWAKEILFCTCVATVAGFARDPKHIH